MIYNVNNEFTGKNSDGHVKMMRSKHAILNNNNKTPCTTCLTLLCNLHTYLTMQQSYLTLLVEGGGRVKISDSSSSSFIQSFCTVENDVNYTSTKMVLIKACFLIRRLLFYYAHIWSKSGISMCWGHLVTSKESSNLIFFRKRHI